MKKTALEWFELIQDPDVKAEAIKHYSNAIKESSMYGERKGRGYWTFYDALAYSFSWKQTPQGDEFWRFLANNLCKTIPNDRSAMVRNHQ
jgi:hypothetical protein